jgi:hypothetical protein
MSTFSLTGLSGKKYVFESCDANGNWNTVPGLYAFCDPGCWPKYIGQTESFATRQPGPTHEKWLLASVYGAVNVAAMVLTGGEEVRKAAELDLIHAYDPPANTQGRLGSLLVGRVVPGATAPAFPVRRKGLLSGE